MHLEKVLSQILNKLQKDCTKPASLFSKQGYDFQILCNQQHSEYYLLLEQGHAIPLFSSRKGSLSYLLKKRKEKGRVASVYMREYINLILSILNFFFLHWDGNNAGSCSYDSCCNVLLHLFTITCRILRIDFSTLRIFIF